MGTSMWDRIRASIKRIWERPSTYQDRKTCVDIDRLLGPIPPTGPAERPPAS